MPDVRLARRTLLQLAVTPVLAGTFARDASPGAGPGQQAEVRRRAMLHTDFCDRFGIRHPVVQAPMPGVATPEMVAAVANAGGLGLFAATGLAPDAVRAAIRRIRELTAAPFGVNLLLHPSIRTPSQPHDIAGGTVRAIQQVLDRFRARLGLAAGPAEVPPMPATIDDAFAVVAEERVPVFSAALGLPSPSMLERCRSRGIKVIGMAATVPDALELEALGVDAIVAQGGDAGGHRSTWVKRPSPEMAAIGTLSLVPQVVDAVRVPVIAAGGIVNGRQLVAAVALGAGGVLMGTRFVATRESAAPAFYKQSLVDRGSDDTTVTDAFTGLYARVLRTTFTEEYRASGAPTIPTVQRALAADVTAASAAQGSGEFYPMYAGQGVGMIRDVADAAAVVETIVAEARDTLARLASPDRRV